MAGEPPVIEGTGEQSRDFTFVGNVVRANVLAAEAGGVEGRTFNIASGESRTVNELAGTLQEILETNIEPTHAPARLGDVLHSAADITRARRELGYEPHYTLEQGLRITAEYFADSLARF